MELDRNHDHFLLARPSPHLGQRAFTWAELPVPSELQEPLGNHMEDSIRTAWKLRALLLLRDFQRGCCSPRVWMLWMMEKERQHELIASPYTLCHTPHQHRRLCNSIVKVPACPPPIPRPPSVAGSKNELCLNSRAHKATPKTGLSHCWSVHWEQGHVRSSCRWGAVIPTYKLSCLWWIQIESSESRHPEGKWKAEGTWGWN